MKLDLYEFCMPELQEKLLPNRLRYKEVEDKKAVSHPRNSSKRPYVQCSGPFPPKDRITGYTLDISSCIGWGHCVLGSWF